jgi:hypothetical protein
MQQPAGKITVEDFTEATFNAVLRAIEARKFPHGPIIYGIVYMPQGLPGEIISPAQQVSRSEGAE